MIEIYILHYFWRIMYECIRPYVSYCTNSTIIKEKEQTVHREFVFEL